MRGNWRTIYNIIKNKKIGLISLSAIAIMLVLLKIGTNGTEMPPDNKIEENQVEQAEIEELQKNEQIVTNIRVLLKTNGFEQVTHPVVQISAPSGLVISANGQEEQIAGGQIFEIYPNDQRFTSGKIAVRTIVTEEKLQVHSLQRGGVVPSYRGVVDLFSTQEGLAIVNELNLEDYLKGVLPSEMPSYFEKEALKAQAVCARSYAYNHMKSYAYPEYEAHVDDSTSYQVYNNSSESEIGNAAIEETSNQKLGYNGIVITTYFFSTSSGHTTDLGAWGTVMTDANLYLKGIPVMEGSHVYESHLPWYRWSVTISRKELEYILELNTSTEIGNLKTFEVTRRGVGEIALEIKATGDAGEIVVQTENKIRRALGGTSYSIQKNDGTVVSGTTLLPSAFFEVVDQGDNFIISGGGYGHGIGMSQHGANEMAKEGMTYQEILYTFYVGTEIIE